MINKQPEVKDNYRLLIQLNIDQGVIIPDSRTRIAINERRRFDIPISGGRAELKF